MLRPVRYTGPLEGAKTCSWRRQPDFRCWTRFPSFWEQKLAEMNPCPAEPLGELIWSWTRLLLLSAQLQANSKCIWL